MSEPKRLGEAGVINDPLGQLTNTARSDVLSLDYEEVLGRTDGQKEGRTDNLCENSLLDCGRPRGSIGEAGDGGVFMASCGGRQNSDIRLCFPPGR